MTSHGLGIMYNGSRPCSHYHTLLLLSTKLLALGSNFTHRNARIARSSCTNDGKSVLGRLVALIRCANVPDVCLKSIAPTTDAHLRKVPNGVFCF